MFSILGVNVTALWPSESSPARGDNLVGEIPQVLVTQFTDPSPRKSSFREAKLNERK
jgi:hypothetical protein